MRGVSCRTRSSAGGPLWSSCFRLAQRQQIQISSDTYPRVITKHVDAGIGFQSVGQLYTPLLTGTEANTLSGSPISTNLTIPQRSEARSVGKEYAHQCRFWCSTIIDKK